MHEIMQKSDSFLIVQWFETVGWVTGRAAGL